MSFSHHPSASVAALLLATASNATAQDADYWIST